MANSINVSECNTLPVLDNINVSTVILPPHQHYLSLYIYIRYMSQVSYGNPPKSAESNRSFPRMAARATADRPRTIMGIKRTSADNQ